MSQKPAHPRLRAVPVSRPPATLDKPENMKPTMKKVVKISAISTPCAVSS